MHDTDLSGEALRNEIADFFFSFQGIKDCSTHTAAAATMLHASLASEGFNLHIRQSLIAGIGLNCTDKEKIAGLTASIGCIPVNYSTHSWNHSKMKNGQGY